MNNASLTIENVTKRYTKDGTQTLKGISLDIQPGEFITLVGPSGCGKSTLLNMIAGLETVTSGRMAIGEDDVTHLDPKHRDIAMVFQSYALYPNMTVYDNIAFGLQIRKMPKAKIQEEVERVTRLLQIDHLLKRKPGQLSGGQQQRVAMGRALARRPQIYLFDEPLSNLDAKLRVEMRTEVKKLHQRLGTTIVYVTHDQIEAMTLADRIAVMKDGIIQQLGTPKQVYETPTNLFVASFIGSPSMNFIPVTVNEQDGALSTVLIDKEGHEHTLPLPDYLRSYAGHNVLLGIRPEHITEPQPHKREGSKTTVELVLPVDVIEPTGPDILTLVQLNEEEVSCRVASDHELVPGESTHFLLDLSRAVYFDPRTEQRILPPC